MTGTFGSTRSKRPAAPAGPIRRIDINRLKSPRNSATNGRVGLSIARLGSSASAGRITQIRTTIQHGAGRQVKSADIVPSNSRPVDKAFMQFSCTNGKILDDVANSIVSKASLDGRKTVIRQNRPPAFFVTAQRPNKAMRRPNSVPSKLQLNKGRMAEKASDETTMKKVNQTRNTTTKATFLPNFISSKKTDIGSRNGSDSRNDNIQRNVSSAKRSSSLIRRSLSAPKSTFKQATPIARPSAPTSNKPSSSNYKPSPSNLKPSGPKFNSPAPTPKASLSISKPSNRVFTASSTSSKPPIADFKASSQNPRTTVPNFKNSTPISRNSAPTSKNSTPAFRNSAANFKPSITSSTRKLQLEKSNSVPSITKTSSKSSKPNSASSSKPSSASSTKLDGGGSKSTSATNDIRVQSATKNSFSSFLSGLFKTNPVDDDVKKSKDAGQEGVHEKTMKNELVSTTYDVNKLTTINEEKELNDTTVVKKRSGIVRSISLDDDPCPISYPFPRPLSASTRCQSFQFMEVATGWIWNGEQGRRGRMEEPLGMFDVDGCSVAGDFIELKEDVAKSRKIIKSRLGVKTENQPETVIQWKRGPVLGRGAFGTVWCGLTMAGELIAVKQAEMSAIDTRKAQKEYEKIQQEIDVLKCLNHKNVVGYLGTSLEERVISIFMQFIPGGSIASILRKFGALAEPVLACYTKQILEGVEYLHSKNVVHRDIKGSNIMLMPNALIKLIDFGCAKRAMNLTKSSEEILKSMKGTPYWMAPEVMNETGHGKKSDIWSIGCTVFEMGTSLPPWSQLNRYAALFTISNGTAKPPQLPDKFSAEVKRFVAECMTRDPEKRPDATTLLNSKFIQQYCQGKRILDSRGAPRNSNKRQ